MVFLKWIPIFVGTNKADSYKSTLHNTTYITPIIHIYIVLSTDFYGINVISVIIK